MAFSRFEWIDRLKAVEREHRVTAASVERMRLAVSQETARLPDGTTPCDLVAAVTSLESTYLIRLWAEFETALLSYYRSVQGKPDARLKAADLVNALAGVRRGQAIADDVRLAVHEVREYRNTLVHERTDPAPPIALTGARSSLNTFLGRLPEQWS